MFGVLLPVSGRHYASKKNPAAAGLNKRTSRAARLSHPEGLALCYQLIHAFEVVDDPPGSAGLVHPFLPQV